MDVVDEVVEILHGYAEAVTGADDDAEEDEASHHADDAWSLREGGGIRDVGAVHVQGGGSGGGALQKEATSRSKFLVKSTAVVWLGLLPMWAWPSSRTSSSS